jgi:hypothetical protein
VSPIDLARRAELLLRQMSNGKSASLQPSAQAGSPLLTSALTAHRAKSEPSSGSACELTIWHQPRIEGLIGRRARHLGVLNTQHKTFKEEEQGGDAINILRALLTTYVSRGKQTLRRPGPDRIGNVPYDKQTVVRYGLFYLLILVINVPALVVAIYARERVLTFLRWALH